MILTSLRTGITTRLTGATNTFRTAIAQTYLTNTHYKLYFHKAALKFPGLGAGVDVDITFPYCVWDMLPLNFTFDTVNEFPDLRLQFRVSGLESVGLTAVENIMGYLEDRLKNSESSLSITGYKTIRITKYPLTPCYTVDNVWNGIIEYKLELQAN
jgi:hypothetical protein